MDFSENKNILEKYKRFLLENIRGKAKVNEPRIIYKRKLKSKKLVMRSTNNMIKKTKIK